MKPQSPEDMKLANINEYVGTFHPVHCYGYLQRNIHADTYKTSLKADKEVEEGGGATGPTKPT